MKRETQAKVKDTVAQYISLFPQEYDALVAQVANERNNLKNDMAEFEKSNSIKRALYTISETLSNMIFKRLDVDEIKEWSNNKESARWFAREYPQFRISKEI